MSEFCPDEDDLPEGWILSALTDVVDINPPRPQADALPAAAPVTFLPMAAVSEDGNVTDPQTRAFAEVRKGYTAFADGDVILAKITPCFENGKAALVGRLTNGLGFGSSEFHVLRSLGGLLPKFVFHYFHQPAFRQDAAESMSGTAGQARVTTDYMRGLLIPHPPLAEQRRIVEKVEALLAEVNAARARLAKVPTILKRFRQSILAAACSGRLVEDLVDSPGLVEGEFDFLPALPQGWTWSTAIESCSQVVDCHNKTAPYSSSGIRLLRTTNIRDGRLVLDDARYVTEATYRFWSRRCPPEPGDVLFTREAPMGEAALIPPGLRICMGQRIMLLRARPGVTIPEFILIALRAPYVGQYAAEVAVGSGVLHLRVGDVERLPIPIPPIVIQHEIVHRVEALFKLADAIEARVAAATARAEKITRAILAKAFRGELVPTEAELARQDGRDYEPASALLARIRAARATNDEMPTRRPRASAATTAPATPKPGRRRTSGRTG